MGERFELVSGPRGAVAAEIKVKEESLVLLDKKNKVIWSCKLDEIDSILVQQEKKVTIKKRGTKVNATFEFTIDEFEMFVERVLYLFPSIGDLISWESINDEARDRVMTCSSSLNHLHIESGSADQIIDDDDSSEDGSDQNEDEDESSESGSRSQTSRFPEKDRPVMKSIDGTEWRMFRVSRFNRFGQPEPCLLLISTDIEAFQIYSISEGEVLGHYKILEILSILRGEQSISIKVRFDEAAQMKQKSLIIEHVDKPKKNKKSKKKISKASSESGSILGRISVRPSGVRVSKRNSTDRRSTGFLSLIKGARKSFSRRSRAVSENLVFESPTLMDEFCNMMSDVAPEMEFTSKPLEPFKLSGCWHTFHAKVHGSKKPIVLVVNPALGCLFLFKAKVTRAGIVEDSAEAKMSLRIAPRNVSILEHTKKGQDVIVLDFAATEIKEQDVGIPSAGSFDPFKSGVLDQHGSHWNVRSLLASDTGSKSPSTGSSSMLNPVKLVLDMPSRSEFWRLRSCFRSFLNHMEHEREEQFVKSITSPPPRRKSSISAKLSLLTKQDTTPSLVGKTAALVPTVHALDAKCLQARSWLEAAETSFTSKRDIFIGTFNAGDAGAPKPAVLEHWIPRPQHAPVRRGMATIGQTQPQPGDFAMYVIGFQEVSNRFDEWTKALTAYLGENYRLFVSARLWEIGLAIFVHASELRHLSNLVSAAEKTGIRLAKSVTGVQLGNKGGVGIGFRWHDVPIAFINAHLAAQQNKVADRNLNYSQIMQKIELFEHGGNRDILEFEPTHEFEHVFFFGDLNYRVDLDFKKAEAAYKHGDWKTLHLADQLEKERAAGRVFYGFQTALPMFPPTYRWKKGRNELSNKKDQPPSYTDRILWHSRPGLQDSIQLDSYRSAKDLMISDHRPVAAVFRLKIRQPYSWPYHPFTRENEQVPDDVGELDGDTPDWLNWSSPRGDFFISPLEAQQRGCPQIKFNNLSVQLNALEEHQLPPWLRLQLCSPILQNQVSTVFVPGTETNPSVSKNLKKLRYAFEGVGQWSDLHYWYDDLFGIPKIVPVLWDPMYLRTQSILLKVQAGTLKENAALAAQHQAAMGKDVLENEDDPTLVSKVKIQACSGQSCISLQSVVDAISHRLKSSGLTSWNRENTPLVPFSHPIIQGGLVVGRVSGELSLIPPALEHDREQISVLRDDTQEKMRNGQVVISSWVQFQLRSPKRSQSARVFAILSAKGQIHIFSDTTLKERESATTVRNCLARYDLRDSTCSTSSRSDTITLSGCLNLEDGQVYDISFLCDGMSDALMWLTEISKLVPYGKEDVYSQDSKSIRTSSSSKGSGSQKEEHQPEFVNLDDLPPPPIEG